MGNFQLPRTTLLDTNGDPIPSGTLEFYLAGTSTPLAVYNDQALTSAIGTSITADGDGRCQNAWIDSDTAYKVIVKDSGGSEVYTEDNLLPFAVTGDSAASYQNKIASHPLSYGAVGDGAADESTEVQSAIDGATGTVDLLGLVFRCDSALTIPENRRIINGTLDFSAATDANLMDMDTGTLGSSLALTADCDVGDNSVEVSTGDAATLAAGNWVLLTSTVDWDGTNDAGEICKVKSVSGTTVTFAQQTMGSYTVATTAVLKEFGIKRNVLLERVKVIASQTSAQNCFRSRYSQDVTLKDCQFEGFKTKGVLFETCINPRVERCSFLDAQTTSIGVSVENGTAGAEVSGCTFYDIETAIKCGGTSNGVVRYANVHDNYMSYAKFGVDLETMTSHCRVAGNSIRCTESSASIGVRTEGRGNIVSDNNIRFAQGLGIESNVKVAVEYATAAGGSPASTTASGRVFTCTNNVVELCSSYGIQHTQQVGSFDEEYGVLISGNFIVGSESDWAIDVYADNADIFGLEITNNEIYGYDAGIHIFTAAGQSILGGSVSGNTLYSEQTTDSAIELSGAAAGGVRGITVYGNSTYKFSNGVLANNCVDISVSGNSIDTPNANGLEFTDSGAGSAIGNFTVTGNSIWVAGADAINMAVTVGNLSEVAIANNTITTPTGDGISISSGSGVDAQNISITGNTINCNVDTTSCITVVGNALGDVDGVSIASNVCDGGNFGVYCNNVYNLSVSNNAIRAQPNTGTDGDGIEIDECQSVAIVGNAISDSGRNGIEITAASTAVQDFSVSGNSIFESGTNSVLVSMVNEAMQNVAISGNNIRNSAAAGAINITVTDTTSTTALLDGLCISGNNSRTAGKAIEFAINESTGTGTVQSFAILANNLDSSATATHSTIHITGDGDMTDGMISGNHIVGGDYGVSNGITGTTSEVALVANYIHNGTSGNLNGTFTYDATSVTEADLPNMT